MGDARDGRARPAAKPDAGFVTKSLGSIVPIILTYGNINNGNIDVQSSVARFFGIGTWAATRPCS
jgi:hypothetical protein